MNTNKSPRANSRPIRPRCYYRLSYSNASRDEEPKLFRDRDAVAFCELTTGLPAMGYQYGTTIHFYPDDERKLSEFPVFQPEDLLVLPTRPPLNDRDGFVRPNRKIIHAAKTELEALLFAELSEYFDYCTRKHVELSARGAGGLKVEDARQWRHVELYEYSGAMVQNHFIGPAPVKPKRNHTSSIAFFLRVNRVAKLNCDFIASFGMDGYGTLIWNRIIRLRHPEWLAAPRFVMAELIFKKPIPPKPLTPEFIDNGDCVEVRLLT